MATDSRLRPHLLRKFLPRQLDTRERQTLADFQQIGETSSISKPKVNAIIEHVYTATARWSEFATKSAVLPGYAGAIGKELAKLRDGILQTPG